jgi:hypothetical protein
MPVVLLLPGTMAAPRGGSAWRAKASCLAVALCVIAPWWVRNIVVTQAFMPLGSQGALNLPAGFGPRALANEGVWTQSHQDGADRPYIRSLDPTRWEVELGRIRMRLGIQWMRGHFQQVVQLMYLHVWQEVRPRGHLLTDLLLPAAVAGMVVLRRVPGLSVLALIVCANLASIAMTWSARGLFMIPLQPILMAIIGAAAATLLTRLTGRRSSHPGETYLGVACQP